MDKVEVFQNESKRLLSTEIVEPKVLENLIEDGFYLNFDFVELPKLKEVSVLFFPQRVTSI